MTPRPIVFVDHAEALGGAERSLLLLLTHLDRGNWEPHLIAPPGPLAEEAIRAGVPVHSFAFPRLRGSSRILPDIWQGAKRVAAIAKDVGAVLIHSNTLRATPYGAVAARLASVPAVWHLREVWLTENEPSLKWADQSLKWVLCCMVSRVVAISRSVATHLPCKGKVVVLHNGIDVSHFAPGQLAADSRADFREAFNFPVDAQIVGMAGRARPLKGQDVFLRMAGRIAGSQPNCRFLVVGGDPFHVEDDYQASLKKLCSQLGLDDRVHWTGQVSDVRPALESMDIFVSPGAPEGFGLVNVEAMAMGKPVVAYAHGAVPDIVAQDRTGLQVTPGDEAGLADAVLRLLRDPSTGRRMGRAGRQRVDSHFRIERTVHELEALYRDLVGTV